jgi:Fe-Mn family superoxide dismutase
MNTKSPNKSILADVDVDGIVSKTIREHLAKEMPEPVNEAYVSEPKTFKQVTEFLSQKAKAAHVELYKGYVESSNKTSSELDTADRSEINSRHADFRSLKMDETYNLNAVWLHELYFSNCFDPHSEIAMDSNAYLRLQRDFGTFDDWQKDFMACAMSAGNGWAVCGYHLFLRKFVNTFVSHHSGDVMMGLFPVIVVDMWEHSYTRDYLNDKKSYLVAVMREFNWNVIEDRFNRAEKLAQAVK